MYLVYFVKSYLGYVELKKIWIIFKYRGFMFIYIYICIYLIVGFGNIVKFLIIVLKFVYNKICYMVKKII